MRSGLRSAFALIVFIGLFAAGCGPQTTPAPTAVPLPTATPIPLAQLDLAALTCQVADLPEGFRETGRTGEGVGVFYEEHRLGITGFQRVAFERPNEAGAAAPADLITCYLYVLISDQLAEQIFPYSQVPAGGYTLGDAYNSVLKQIAADTYVIEIMWMYREAIGHVIYVGPLQGTKGETVMLVSLVAEKVQARLAAVGK